MKNIVSNDDLEIKIKKIEEENKVLKTALNLTNVGIWRLNLRNGKLCWNERMYEIYGVPPETEITYKKILEMIIEEDVPIIETSIQNMREYFGIEHIEFRIKYPENTIKNIHSRITIIKDNYNEPVEVLGIEFDITNSKKSEEKIKWLANFPEQSPNYIICINPENEIIYSNPIGKQLMNLMIQDDSLLLNKEWDAIIGKTNEQPQFKTEVICAGRILLLNISKNLETEYIYIYGSDITERKENELVIQQKNEELIKSNEKFSEINEKLSFVNEELIKTFNEREKSEENYRLLFENMPLGIAIFKSIINKDGKPSDFIYLSVNESYVKLTGHKENKIIGKSILEVMPELEKEWVDIYSNVVMTGESREFEHYRASLDRFLKVKAYSPEKNNIVTIVDDITDKKLEETKINLQKDELETLNEELTITNEKLEKAYLVKSESEEKFKLLFENVPLGLALYETVTDNKGNPVDFIYISINEAYENLTGLERKNIIGKTMLHVMPDLEPEWLKLYSEVVLSGKPVQYEHYRTSLNKHLRVRAYIANKNNIVSIVDEIKKNK
ncbi:MAG: PAS domain S-box protein [Bacteroidota bacterium]|nr:PAS domain S-box protein [Bacteroidota bacterium]